MKKSIATLLLTAAALAAKVGTPAAEVFQTVTSTVVARGVDYTCSFSYSGPFAGNYPVAQRCTKNAVSSGDVQQPVNADIYVNLNNLNSLRQTIVLGRDAFSYVIGGNSGGSTIQLQITLGSTYKVFYFNAF